MQKATVKLLLKNNKKNALGQLPIYLCISSNRKRSYTSTGFYILPRQWDERTETVKNSHANHEQINGVITQKKTEALEELVQAAIDKRVVSAKSVKQVITPELRDIYLFSDKLIAEGSHRKSKSTHNNYRKHLTKLKEFAGDKLAFDDITPDLLQQFESWLRKNVKARSNNPGNYIGVIMRTIRSHFNQAISRGLTSNYPFKTYKAPKETPGNKDFLSLKELRQWHDFTFETEHAQYQQAALYFLFGCYTGLRLSDWKDFAEAKVKARNISVQATKNKVWVNVPLHDGLIAVIKKMKEVPLTIAEPQINRHLKEIAGALKINKHLSTHSGRRTFAVTLCLERGVSAETTAKLMGITLAVFEKNYSFVTKEKIQLETGKAWKGLF